MLSILFELPFFNIHDLRTFETCIALCTAGHGRSFNQAIPARTFGVSEPTVKSRGDLLNATDICNFLLPFFNNYNKRLIKTPKLYF